jgi:hypothetical protein
MPWRVVEPWIWTFIKHRPSTCLDANLGLFIASLLAPSIRIRLLFARRISQSCLPDVDRLVVFSNQASTEWRPDGESAVNEWTPFEAVGMGMLQRSPPAGEHIKGPLYLAAASIYLSNVSRFSIAVPPDTVAILSPSQNPVWHCIHRRAAASSASYENPLKPTNGLILWRTCHPESQK